MANSWIPAHNVALTHSGVTYNCTQCSARLTQGTFDATNTQSDGWRVSGNDVKECSLRGTALQDTDAVTSLPTVGGSATATFTITNGQQYSGTFKVTSLEQTGGGRGGYSFSFELESQGTVTIS